jgi:hypothetical protein
MLDSKPRVLTEEFLKRFSLMGGGVVQQDDDGATKVPQQGTQKHTDFLLGDIVKEKEIVEAQVVPLGADRNSGDHRDFSPAPLAMAMDGGFPLRSPGSHHRGN